MYGKNPKQTADVKRYSFLLLLKKWDLNRSSFFLYYIQSVQFSRSVVSDSLRPHESQHARPPCPSPTPGIHPNSCPSSRWCHPAISSSVITFSSCLQSRPASESFPMSQLFAWDGNAMWRESRPHLHNIFFLPTKLKKVGKTTREVAVVGNIMPLHKGVQF